MPTDTFLGAEEAANDDGMVSGPLDLSYMGVYTVWMNLLGKSSRQLYFNYKNDCLQAKRPSRV